MRFWRVVVLVISTTLISADAFSQEADAFNIDVISKKETKRTERQKERIERRLHRKAHPWDERSRRQKLADLRILLFMAIGAGLAVKTISGE